MADPKGFDPSFDDRKDEDTLYFSKSTQQKDGSSYRKVELLMSEDRTYLSEKTCGDRSIPVKFEIKENVTLFETDGGQQKIQCWLMESSTGKYVEALHISRRTAKGLYGSQEIVLSYKGLYALQAFIKNLFLVENPNRIKMPIQYPNESSSEASRILSESEFHQLIKANIRSTDDFYQLLSIQKMELAIERLARIIEGEFENEIAIQKFLKDNIWMLGNDYVFIIENGKINPKNILDIVPRNFENYIDIVEVKLPTEKLFNYDDSHNNYYSTAGLTKAIAQTQNYIFELERKSLDAEYQQVNNCAIVRPKGIIIMGSNNPPVDEERRYLRILNSSYHNLQIITYQQLLTKAENTLRILKEEQGK